MTTLLAPTFELLNGDRNTSDAVIYRRRDNDQRANTLILRLTARGQIALPGGAMPPDGGPADNSPAALYLTFGDIFDTHVSVEVCSAKGSEWQPLADSGWQQKVIAGQKPTLCLSRTTPVTLNDKETFEFKLKPVFYTGSDPEVTIDYYNMQGHGPHKTRIEVRVSDRPEYRVDPPLRAWVSGADNTTPAQLFISPSEYSLNNRLTLHLLNEGRAPLAPHVSFDPNQRPSFRVSFQTGNASDRSALTTEEKVKAIKVQESGGWAASIEGSIIPVTWRLEPDKPEVLGGGEELQVVFDHLEIPAEFSTGGSCVWLEYRNLPGYNDGIQAVPVQRAKAPAAIDGFALKAANIVADEPAYLIWRSTAVPFLGLRYRRIDSAEITYYPKAGEIGLPLQTGPGGFEIPPFDVGDGGTFSLEGFLDKPAFLNHDEPMGLLKRQSLSVTYPPTAIKAFTVSRHRPLAQSPAEPALLTWQVQPNECWESVKIKQNNSPLTLTVEEKKDRRKEVAGVTQGAQFEIEATGRDGKTATMKTEFREVVTSFVVTPDLPLILGPSPATLTWKVAPDDRSKVLTIKHGVVPLPLTDEHRTSQTMKVESVSESSGFELGYMGYDGKLATVKETYNSASQSVEDLLLRTAEYQGQREYILEGNRSITHTLYINVHISNDRTVSLTVGNGVHNHSNISKGPMNLTPDKKHLVCNIQGGSWILAHNTAIGNLVLNCDPNKTLRFDITPNALHLDWPEKDEWWRVETPRAGYQPERYEGQGPRTELKVRWPRS